MTALRFTAIGACVLLVGCAAAPTAAPVEWGSFERAAFAEAERDDKLVLLTVTTKWCHWCHVMDAETYADPEVRGVLERSFVTLREDADARPDLGERYRAWGWPAIAFLTSDGEPVTTLRGYRSRDVFLDLLHDLEAEHRAGTLRPRKDQSAEADAVPAELAVALEAAWDALDESWDEDRAGWGAPQKYPRGEPIVASLRADEPVATDRALRTLRAQEALLDPVWGGMYQYSEVGVWDRPHFEKIVPVQASTLHAAAEAVRRLGDPAARRTIGSIAGYLDAFLTREDGAFFTSQDADLFGHDDPRHLPGDRFYALGDAGRRALGVPHVDEHVYADRNGMLIGALVAVANATGDRRALDSARRAADQLLASHALPSGGFLHAADDDPDGLFHLADAVWMGDALVRLGEATGEEAYLQAAERTADFMERRLATDSGAFAAHTPYPDAVGVFAEPRRPPTQNAVAARFLLRLGRLLEDPDRVERAGEVVATWSTDELRRQGRRVGHALLALQSLRHEPVVVTIVGPAAESDVAELRAAALALPQPHLVVRSARAGGAFPDLGRPAAYVCSPTRCSDPVFDTLALADAVVRFLE